MVECPTCNQQIPKTRKLFFSKPFDEIPISRYTNMIIVDATIEPDSIIINNIYTSETMKRVVNK